MCDHLGDLARLQTAIEREIHVLRHLDCLISRNQSCKSKSRCDLAAGALDRSIALQRVRARTSQAP